MFVKSVYIYRGKSRVLGNAGMDALIAVQLFEGRLVHFTLRMLVHGAIGSVQRQIVSDRGRRRHADHGCREKHQR